jgi:hypothetical protein
VGRDKWQGRRRRNGSPRVCTPSARSSAGSFFALKRDAARGVDGMTWQDSEKEREPRLSALHDRVDSGAYRPQPSRRRYIPKPDGRPRPLAGAAREDKIIQRAAVLNGSTRKTFSGSPMGSGRGAASTMRWTGWRHSRWSFTVRRPGSSSSGAMRRKTASGAGSANRRLSTFWQLSGLHRYQQPYPARQIPAQAEIPSRPAAGEAPGGQRRAAAAPARGDPRAAEMAAAGHHRRLQLSCRANQYRGAAGLPGCRRAALATRARAAQPTRRWQLVADGEAARDWLPAPRILHPSPRQRFARHPPAVGAVCGKAARTVLCGAQ